MGTADDPTDDDFTSVPGEALAEAIVALIRHRREVATLSSPSHPYNHFVHYSSLTAIRNICQSQRRSAKEPLDQY
jgi:LmbE family N-acetylglucosaminyl deacetylase